MEFSNSTRTCWLLKAGTVKVFMGFFWYKCAMFNISVKQSQFTLFMTKLKNLTSNQIKKNPIPTTFWRTLANELITFTWSFIYQFKKQKDQRISYRLPLLLKFIINMFNFHFNSSFDYLLRRINWRASYKIFRKPFGCQMTYKIRPGHKQFTSKNKFSKAYIWKKGAVLGRVSLSAVWWVIFKNNFHAQRSKTCIIMAIKKVC